MDRISLVELAPELSSHNMATLGTSDDVVGCYSCLRLHRRCEVLEAADGGATAICPLCGVDAVVGGPLVACLDVGLLRAMGERWFRGPQA